MSSLLTEGDLTHEEQASPVACIAKAPPAKPWTRAPSR